MSTVHYFVCLNSCLNLVIPSETNVACHIVFVPLRPNEYLQRIKKIVSVYVSLILMLEKDVN